MSDTLTAEIVRQRRIAESYRDTEPDCEPAMEAKRLATWLEEVRRLRERVAELEAKQSAIRDLLTPLLGAEVYPTCAGEGRVLEIVRCSTCHGTGQRNIADGLSVMEFVQRLAKWYTALDDALVVGWCWNKDHDTDPRKALNALVCANTRIALDPSVSEEAAKLRDTYLAERDELREQVAKLREALARIASDEPFIVQCGGGIDVAASMQAVNRANYERIAKLIAAEVLAATAPKEPAK